MARALHITNGDGALYLLGKAGILGTHLAWRDALNDGPVPFGFSLEKTSETRAHYLASRGYGSPIKLIHDFERRDAQVRRAAEFEEVVLWFEHDLYDQLQLLQALTSLEELNLEPGRVATIQSDHYLASMTVDEILPLLPRRRTATAAIFKSARRNWERFTSPSPTELYAAAGEDAIGLPFLRAAMQRLCEEYPATRDGLSRSQRQTLLAVAQGAARSDELFTRTQAREEASFHGQPRIRRHARRAARRRGSAHRRQRRELGSDAPGPPSFGRRCGLAWREADRSLDRRGPRYPRESHPLGRRRRALRMSIA